MNKYLRVIIWLLFIFGGIALSMYIDKHIFHYERITDTWLYYIINMVGIILFVWAFIVSGNVRRTLNKHGRKSKGLSRLQTDTLVTTGVYSMMRHPMSQALLTFPMAVALMATSPSFIFIIAPLETLIMILMIRFIEENETRKKFGEAYDSYCMNTPRFCYRWQCIKALLKNPDASL